MRTLTHTPLLPGNSVRELPLSIPVTTFQTFMEHYGHTQCIGEHTSDRRGYGAEKYMGHCGIN